MRYDLNDIQKQIKKQKSNPISSADRIRMAFGENKPKIRQTNQESHATNRQSSNNKYNINIQMRYNQFNTEKSEVILPIEDDNGMRKPNLNNGNNKPKQNAKGISKLHPKIFSNDAMETLESDKHVIIGSKHCGVCSQQKKIIDGQYVSLDVDVVGKTNKNGDLVGIKLEPKSNWDSFKNTIEQNEKTFRKMDNLEKKLAQKLPQVQNGLSEINRQRQVVMNDGRDKKTLAQLDAREKQLQSFIQDYETVKKVKEQSEHLFKTNKALLDPSIDYENTLKKYQMIYVDGDDRKENKVANEIADNFDLEGYPMQVLDKCEAKSKDKKELAKCKVEGMKSPMQLVTFDAQQRGDMDKLDYVKELQKKLRDM